MYKITGTREAKFVSGNFIRFTNLFEEYLNTEDGVAKFLAEQAPLTNVKVVLMEGGADVTEKFV